MEDAMRFLIPATAVGAVLAAGLTAAHAQTVITRQVVNPAVETIQTTETVRTVRPASRRAARRQVVTTRTVTRQIVPAASVVARTVPAVPQGLYDEVTPEPIINSPDDYGPPLYDRAVPATDVTVPAPAATPIVQNGSVIGSAPFIYRYVYEPDRILVIDPTTNIAVQAIPR
jgi:hypothetical protein